MTPAASARGIADWLRALGLDQYEPLFRAQAIDFDVLLQLDDGDLKELAIPLGDRKRILGGIARLKSGNDPQASPRIEGQGAAADAGGAERRQITIMFCDLVNSTQLANELDPEDFGDVLRAYRACCSELVARWKGQVVEYYGDGVMAYFGWPRAQEDDAERAVRAGLDLAAAVARIRAGTASFALATRIGIATGLVLVGELMGGSRSQEKNAVGAIPNLANRLQSIAEPGAIVIAASTYQLVGGLFACTDLGPLQLKGFREEMRAWRVDSPSATTRFAARLTRRAASFVGRKREWATLLQLWDQARQGCGQVGLVWGEAGVGKSRLVRKLAETPGDIPHASLEWQCSSSHTNTALHPFAERFNHAARIASSDPPELKLQKAERFLAEIEYEIGDAAPILASVLSISFAANGPASDPRWQRQQAIDVVMRLILAGARTRPLLFLVEDLHWADPTTVELLRQLAGIVRNHAVLLVITGRPDGQAEWPAQPGLTTIALGPLGRSASRLMIQGLAGEKALPQQVMDAILSGTDGIPLFMEELTRTVLESGRLRESDDRYELDGSVLDLSIPVTLRDSLTARLDRLLADKQVAQVAATIGRSFSPDLLARVLQRPVAELDQALSHLSEAGILDQRGLPSARRYAFRHALIQEAAYRSQLNARRREVHWRVAHAIETHSPAEAKAAPETLAHHFVEAGLPELAAKYLLEAGRNALRLSAVKEALAHLTRGLELIGPLPSSPSRDLLALRLHASLGIAFTFGKSWAASEAEDAYRAADMLMHAATDPTEAMWIMWGIWVYHHVRGDTRAAAGARDRMRDAAERFGDAGSRMVADMVSMQVSFYTGQFAASVTTGDEFEAAFRASEHRSLMNLYTVDLGLVVRVHRAIACWILGRSDEARVLADGAERLARTLEHSYSIAWTLTWGSTPYLLRGDLDVLGARLDEGIALADRHRFSYIAAMGRIMRGWLKGRCGALSAGIREAQSAIETFQATGAGIVVPHFRTLSAELLGAAGRSDEALQMLRQAELQIERWGERWQLAEVHRVAGDVLARGGGSIEAATRHFQQAIAVARSQGAEGWERRARAGLSRVLGRGDGPEEAHAAAVAAEAAAATDEGEARSCTT